MSDSKKTMDLLDGSNITDLVQNEHVFNKLVDHKCEELDQNRDGKLSVKELVPAVADIGAALRLPVQGSSSNSDHIYDEVRSNIVEPSLQLSQYQSRKPISQEIFLEAFKRTVEDMVVRLMEQPVIVAHSGNTFDGSGIKRILSTKYELDKIDVIISEVFKMVKAEEGGVVEQEEFNKLMLEILSSIMLQLQGRPVVTANVVINEPHTSTFLSPSH